MNAKKKLTSLISLTLALCMLLSTAAMALESTGASSSDAGASSYTEPDRHRNPARTLTAPPKGTPPAAPSLWSPPPNRPRSRMRAAATPTRPPT